MSSVDLSTVPRVLPADRPTPPTFRDPNFHRAADWLADGREDDASFIVFGAPYAGGSISRAQCDLAPEAIRRSLERFSTYSSDFDVSLDGLKVFDLGDMPRSIAIAVEEFQRHVQDVVGAIRAQTEAPVAIMGGDNSITVGGARGAGADALITFDAHHDVRDTDENGATNGSPVRQLIEGGIPGNRVVQIGIHGFSNAAAYARYAVDAGIHIVPPGAVRTLGIDAIIEDALVKLEAAGARRIWVDVDMDCLERALAPGAPAAMPGGLLPADLSRAAFRLGHSPLVTGLDITELDPTADLGDATVRTACSVLLAFACGVAIRA
jgi:formiminoglutamase